MIRSLLSFLVLFMTLAIAPLTMAVPATAAGTTQTRQVEPWRLIVRPRSTTGQDIAPSIFSDPLGWVRVQQRIFYDRMAAAMNGVRDHRGTAAWMLMLMSFIYGILHAAGPGHGKAVISAWLMANERQLRRGIAIACLGAFVQASTAIVIVTGVLMLVARAGTTARIIAGTLQSASFALVAMMGLYLLWTAFAPLRLARARADGHSHHHDHHDHYHDEECGCGHAHVPAARRLGSDFSIRQALSIALAIGIRPCSGALLVLLLASAVGLYWAGVASTFAMAVGTAITVSSIAVLAVTSRKLALRLAGHNTRWLTLTATGLKITAGIFITLMGTLLCAGTLSATLIG